MTNQNKPFHYEKGGTAYFKYNMNAKTFNQKMLAQNLPAGTEINVPMGLLQGLQILCFDCTAAISLRSGYGSIKQTVNLITNGSKRIG
jgi:hypothetical protein